MINLEQPEVKFALNIVREASKLVKTIQKEMIGDALTKDDRSPVTIADFASQALVGRALMQEFPNDPLIGEEDSAELKSAGKASTLDQITAFINAHGIEVGKEEICDWIDHGSAESGERYWTVDPIDGTKGFLRGEQYAVALALVENGIIQVGVLGCPNLTDGYIQEIGGPGSLVIAARGQGTWTTPLFTEGEFRQLKVSDRANPADARFLRSYESGHTNVSQLDIIGEEMGVSAEPVRLDSQAKYAILASGAGDCLFRLISEKMPDYKEKIWDQAAGAIVTEEAGGKITDLDGNPLDFTQGRKLLRNRGILASNTLLHQPALDAIKKVKA
ncbi:MAG: 3'(2'),5'-bisphosphate nucleotidase [Anaerolineales bacterium]|nr:3'(2'),5'-bisphosphate nucleotidase [Anaerolineales bacterium]